MVTNKDGTIKHADLSSEKDCNEIYGMFCASPFLITFNSPYDKSEEMQKRQESARKISECYAALTSQKHQQAATKLKYAAVFVNQMLFKGNKICERKWDSSSFYKSQSIKSKQI